MTKYLGKGVKGVLRKLHIRNDQMEIIKTLNDHKEIKDAIIKYNREYLKQAHQIPMYNDRIYKQLSNNKIRDKILIGKLEQDDYTNKEVFRFLNLLKKSNETPDNIEFEPINIEEWKNAVKSSKKHSTSSIYSQQTYAIYKYALS